MNNNELNRRGFLRNVSGSLGFSLLGGQFPSLLKASPNPQLPANPTSQPFELPRPGKGYLEFAKVSLGSSSKNLR